MDVSRHFDKTLASIRYIDPFSPAGSTTQNMWQHSTVTMMCGTFVLRVQDMLDAQATLPIFVTSLKTLRMSQRVPMYVCVNIS